MSDDCDGERVCVGVLLCVSEWGIRGIGVIGVDEGRSSRVRV